MFKKLAKISIAIFVVALCTTTFAKGPTHQCYCKPFDKMINLNLTPEQETKILDIRKQTHQSLQATYVDLKSVQSQIRGLITSSKLDESKLDALVNQKKELLASIMKARIKMRNQVYNLLDDSQKSSFVKIMDRREARKNQEINSAPQPMPTSNSKPTPNS